MEHIARDITELVGRTPLLEAARFGKARGLSCRLLAKLEYLNPAGSVKDRVALRESVPELLRRGPPSLSPPRGTRASAWLPWALPGATG